MIVRRERPGDVAAARAVQAAVFPTPEGAEEPVEAGLLDQLREDEGWIEALSLVAEVDGEVVGHVVCTRGTVGADRRPELSPAQLYDRLVDVHHVQVPVFDWGGQRLVRVAPHLHADLEDVEALAMALRAEGFAATFTAGSGEPALTDKVDV